MRSIWPALLVALSLPVCGSSQTLGSTEWLTMEPVHSVKDPRYVTEYGPFHVAPYIYKFDYTYNPIVGNKDGYYGYRFDPAGGEPVLVKSLAVDIQNENGGIIGIVALTDRLLVAYYKHEPKDETAELWVRHLDLKEMDPLGEPVKAGSIEFKDRVSQAFMPILRLSPDRKRILLYDDRVKTKEDGALMMCWVLDSGLNSLWNAAYPRPNYMSTMADFWNREVSLANDGSVHVIMRPLRADVGLYTNVTDPEKITNLKLYRLMGPDMRVMDLAMRSIPLKEPMIMPSDSGVFLAAFVPKSKGPASAADRTLFRITDTLSLEPVFKLKGIAGEDELAMVPRAKGGWYVVTRSTAGLGVTACDGRGKVEWTSKFPYWLADLHQVLEYRDDLFVVSFVQTGALKDHQKGKPIVTKDKTFRRTPLYLRCTGKNEATVGAIFDPEEGGERDVIKYFAKDYESVSESGMFMEPSRDGKRPGIMVVHIP